MLRWYDVYHLEALKQITPVSLIKALQLVYVNVKPKTVTSQRLSPHTDSPVHPLISVSDGFCSVDQVTVDSR